MKKLLGITILAASLAASVAVAQPNSGGNGHKAAFLNSKISSKTIGNFTAAAIKAASSISDNQSKGGNTTPAFKQAVVTYNNESGMAKAVVTYKSKVQNVSSDDLKVAVVALNKQSGNAKLCAVSDRTIACFAHNTNSSKLSPENVVAMKVYVQNNTMTFMQVKAKSSLISQIKPGKTKKFSGK
jgi:hypothetical protein